MIKKILENIIIYLEQIDFDQNGEDLSELNTIECKTMEAFYEALQSQEECDHCNSKNTIILSNQAKAIAYANEKNYACVQVFPVMGTLLQKEAITYSVESLAAIDQRYLERVLRRKLDLPWIIFETKEYLVREMTTKDVEELYRIYEDEEIGKFVDPLYEDIEMERSYVQNEMKREYQFYEFGIWVVIDKETDQVIGRAGITMRQDEKDPEIGYLICKTMRGKGVATQILKKILDYAKEELEIRALNAMILCDNLKSIHICEKLGFHYVMNREILTKEYLMYKIIL